MADVRGLMRFIETAILTMFGKTKAFLGRILKMSQSRARLESVY